MQFQCQGYFCRECHGEFYTVSFMESSAVSVSGRVLQFESQEEFCSVSGMESLSVLGIFLQWWCHEEFYSVRVSVMESYVV